MQEQQADPSRLKENGQGGELFELQIAALDAAGSAILITDRDGAIVWANPAFEQLTGYSPEETVGQNPRFLGSGQQPRSFYQEMWEQILAGRKWHGELVNRRKNGGCYEEEMTITPVRNATGQITHFIAIKQDVTERKHAADQMSRLAQAVESSADLIAMADRDGKFVFANRAFLQVLGYQSDEVAGKHFSAIVSQNNPASLLQEFAAKMLQPSGWQGECLARRRDGVEFLVSLNVGPVTDHQGRLIGSFGIGRDISAQKRAEEALRQSEEQFRDLAENIREVFFILSPDPVRITYISPAYDEIWGRPRRELYDRAAAWIESAHPEDRERVGEVFARALRGPTDMGFRVVRPDGAIRWIYARSFPAHDSAGKLSRVVGIAEDVTAKMQEEKALLVTQNKLNLALGEAERQAAQSAQLTELVDVLQSCQTADEAYKVIAAALQVALASPSGAVCLTSTSRNIVEARAHWGDPLTTEKTFGPDQCWALRRGKVHQVKDAGSPLRCAHVNGSPANGYLCVPLAAQGDTLGVLYLECPPQLAASSLDPRSGPPQDLLEVLARQATAVGERISLALANITLREALRGQTIRDPLTGLFNRRFMEESLERELSRAARNNQTVALLMLDIDNFKKFNDAFGHQAGDALLRAFGDFLSQRTRGQDVACRYGGEEFAIILAGADTDAARQRAEMLRNDMQSLIVQHAGQVLGKVTFSVGVAVAPQQGTDADTLMHAADEALYRAKAAGRDRVVVS